MPEGVLHLVACWASFVVVALLFAVMFQLFAIARGHNALQRVGDISLRPTSNSAPKRLHLSLIEKLWPPSTEPVLFDMFDSGGHFCHRHQRSGDLVK
jgi:hypothetical protein